MIIYVENPDGSLRGVSPVEREAIEPLFRVFAKTPDTVTLTFPNATTVVYRQRES